MLMPLLCQSLQTWKLEETPLNVSESLEGNPQLYTHTHTHIYINVKVKSKGIPASGHGGLWASEMLRIPHCPENWLTDGGKVVNPNHQQRSTPRNIIFLVLVHISVRG
jgi:hypothetical protein